MAFKPIKKSDKVKELFYKIPKQLMLEAKYKKMKDSSKILYSILYERTDLSLKNNWVDDNEDTYIICTLDEMQVYFGASRDKVNNALKDLEKFELIRKSKLVTKEGNTVNALYVGHVETTEDTLQVLMDKHKEDYHALRKKKIEYKREYDRKQAELKKAKRASKLTESENQTTIANTTIPRVKIMKSSNFNRSPKIRLRVVRKSDYINTNNIKTENISMYVCTEEQQKQSFLNLYEKHLTPSKYVEKVLTAIEEKDQMTVELLEVIILKAINNNRVQDKEKWIIGTINKQIEKNIKTVEEYETSLKAYGEVLKAFKKSNTSNGSNSNKDYKVKTRFHNITDRTKNYTPEELEKVLKNSQAIKQAEKEARELKEQSEEVTPIEINDDFIEKCWKEDYFKTLNHATKVAVKKYMKDNCRLFIPWHIDTIEIA